jgi:methyl-accepting chemotaxis protein
MLTRRSVWRVLRPMPLLLPVVACAAADQGTTGKANVAALEARATAQLLDDWVGRVALLSLGTAVRQQVAGRDPAPGTVEYLAAMLDAQPRDDVYGLYIAFERMNWRDPRAMPWVDRASCPRAGIVQYDFHDARQDWYAGAKRSGKLHITEPFFDDGGSNITMVSVTRPVNDTSGRFFAVAGADISLEDIQKHLKSTVGEMYLVSAAGRVIAHPNAQLRVRKGYPGEELRNLPGGALVAASPSGNAFVPYGASSRTLAWATAAATGWKVVVSIP